MFKKGLVLVLILSLFLCLGMVNGKVINLDPIVTDKNITKSNDYVISFKTTNSSPEEVMADYNFFNNFPDGKKYYSVQLTYDIKHRPVLTLRVFDNFKRGFDLSYSYSEIIYKDYYNNTYVQEHINTIHFNVPDRSGGFIYFKTNGGEYNMWSMWTISDPETHWHAEADTGPSKCDNNKYAEIPKESNGHSLVITLHCENNIWGGLDHNDISVLIVRWDITEDIWVAANYNWIFSKAKWHLKMRFIYKDKTSYFTETGIVP
jgi:hypothetical protein